MTTSWPRFLLPGLATLLALLPSAPAADAPPRAAILEHPPRRMTPAQRTELVEAFRREAQADLDHAHAVARAQGWSPRGILHGRPFTLEAIRNGKAYVDIADNKNAGISAAADQVRASPFLLTGSNLVVGLWEAGGLVLTNHQELTGRILHKDTGSLSDHATHVAGTLAAAGISNAAAGMAPRLVIHSRNSTLDEAEMAANAMADPSETNTLQLSNHSYSSASGWEPDYTPPRFYGLWPATESDNFGIYETQTRDWDVIAYAAPYYLIFKSAGNNRNDAAPANGASFQYLDGTWKTATYDSASHPLADGWDNGGYDTIVPKGNAKNVITIGAVNDAVFGGTRRLASATMPNFSGWGPTDDGRLKPDLVANGTSLYSCDNDHAKDYATMTGTSMATPSACGTAALLLELYRRLFPGTWPLSSTLKALLLHTADDLGTAGPDYRFGYGLLNARAAADHLLAHAYNPGALRLVEDTLTADTRTNTYPFTWSSGPLRATLCWTDPPGPARTGLDNTNLCLVNNLDLTLLDSLGTPHLPWTLDPANPAAPAVPGLNFRDNVEQVYLSAPAVPGTWTALVTIAHAPTNDLQEYSLLLTGPDDTTPHVHFLSATPLPTGLRFEWNSLTGRIYHLRRATNLLAPVPFTQLLATITGRYLTTVYTDATAPSNRLLFYLLDEP